MSQARRAASASLDDMLHRLVNDELGYSLNDDEMFDRIITVLYQGYEALCMITLALFNKYE